MDSYTIKVRRIALILFIGNLLKVFSPSPQATEILNKTKSGALIREQKEKEF